MEKGYEGCAQLLTSPGVPVSARPHALFWPGLTTIVGENDIGKSMISKAVHPVFEHGANSRVNVITPDDYPYGSPGRMSIELSLNLDDDEVTALIIGSMDRQPSPRYSPNPLAEWLKEMGNDVTLVLERPHDPSPRMQWGNLYFEGGLVSGQPLPTGRGGSAWRDVARAIEEGHRSPSEAIRDELRVWVAAGRNPTGGICLKALEPFKLLEEFRTRSETARTGALESLGGQETASVILNLRTHTEPQQEARYNQIRRSFTKLFPQYEIDAVESTPGGGEPDCDSLRLSLGDVWRFDMSALVSTSC